LIPECDLKENRVYVDGVLVGHVIGEDDWMPAVGERFKFACCDSATHMRLPGKPSAYEFCSVNGDSGIFPAIQLDGDMAGRLVCCASGWRFYQHGVMDDEQFLTIDTCECGKREMP
jgi:hypothetical protein